MSKKPLVGQLVNGKSARKQVVNKQLPCFGFNGILVSSSDNLYTMSIKLAERQLGRGKPKKKYVEDKWPL